MATVVDKLKQQFGSQFRLDEPLAKHVNFRIGGPAKYFVEARQTSELIEATRLAKDLALPYFVLGGGSNTLVSDNGYQGLVIKAANRNLRIEGDLVIAEAGVISATVARTTASQGLRGFEWAISLPGTIGGAVRGNAGCFGGEVKDTLESVQLWQADRVVEIKQSDLHYAYRHSALKEAGREHDVVLEARFRLVPGDRNQALALIDQHLAGRKSSQPLGSSSAGCMFKNFEYQSLSDISKLTAKFEVPTAMQTQRRLGAGWLIDQLGLKGTRLGDAQIAQQHGNFLLNLGQATAVDIVGLISLVKTRARDELGIQLQEEVQYLGF